MMKLEYCQAGCRCDLSETNLDEQMSEYAKFGAIPHCFFPELSCRYLVAGENHDFNEVSQVFYTSPSAFYRQNSNDSQHLHISLAQISAAFSPCFDKISFVCDNGARLELEDSEAFKLLEQSRLASRRFLENEEEIEIGAGEQVIFSTPDPALPKEFVDFLGLSFNGLASEVYAFETTVPGQESSLVIGVVPETEEIQPMAMILAQGADQFLEDRCQIDFMVLDKSEKELFDIIVSVSPQIKVG